MRKDITEQFTDLQSALEKFQQNVKKISKRSVLKKTKSNGSNRIFLTIWKRGATSVMTTE